MLTMEERDPLPTETLVIPRGVGLFLNIYTPQPVYGMPGAPSFGLSFPAILIQELDLSQVRINDRTGTPLVRATRKSAPEIHGSDAWGDDWWLQLANRLQIMQARNLPAERALEPFSFRITVSLFEYSSGGKMIPEVRGKALGLERFELI